MDISGFRKVEIPFTLYDFFGYLLPGIAFGALMLLSFDMPKVLDVVILKLLGHQSPDQNTYLLNDFIWILHSSPFFISILCLLIAYVIGHVLAALSSYLLERLLVQGWLGYPTDNMFALRPVKKPILFRNFRRSYSEDFISQFKKQYQSKFKLPFNSSNDIF